MWLQVWGFLIEVWEIDHFKTVVSTVGDVIEPDDDTDDRRRLDRARLLVRTPLPPAIKKEAIVRVGDIEYRVWMVEEVGDDGDSKLRRTLSSDDWSKEVTSDEGRDVADANDDSDTTFSYSPELSSKKSTTRFTHRSDDITSGHCRETTHSSRPPDNTPSDDIHREETEEREGYPWPIYRKG